MAKRILILCPNLTYKGGVAYYYSLVKKHFSSERVSLEFYHIGKKNRNEIHQNRFIKSLYDLVLLFKIIPKYDLIVLNPSLDLKSVIRDGTFHLVAKRLYKKRTLVFFHGWQPKFERIIDKFGKRIFRFVFNFDKVCVLSKKFKNTFIMWGFDQDAIKLETTVFEQHETNNKKDLFKIIYLSRFEKEKGCLETVQTIENLIKEFPKVRLFMVGDGHMTSELKKYVSNHNLRKNIKFTGWLSGEDKYRYLNQCGIMLFPTFHGEGMPISVVEGMGMGLAVVTRPVAGIPDIIADKENGFLIDSLNPKDFSDKVKYLFQDKEVWEAICNRNRQVAKEKFEIRSVVKRLEQLYFDVAK